MTRERVIWCCRAVTWTRLIAWLQIVVYSSMVVLCLLSKIPALKSIQTWMEMDDPKLGVYWSDNSKSMSVLTELRLIMSASAVFFATLLLYGAHQRKRWFVTVWIIFTVVTMVMDFLIGILHANAHKIPPTLLRILFIAIVFVFHDELKPTIEHSSLTDDGIDDDF